MASIDDIDISGSGEKGAGGFEGSSGGEQGSVPAEPSQGLEM